MIEVSIKGLDERISKLLSKSFRVTDDAEISIAWIRDEEDIEKNPSKVIVDLNFRSSDNDLDIFGKKYDKVIIPKANALFALWQVFSSHFKRNVDVSIFAGILPIHDSHPFRILPLKPAKKFMKIFKEEAFGVYKGKVESFNVLSLRRNVEIKIGDFYQLEAVIFGALDRFLLYKIGKKFHKLYFFLLGRKGFINDLSALLKFNLIECDELYSSLNEYEDEDLFLFQISIINRFMKSLEVWKVEMEYDYSKNEKAIDRATLALIEILLKAIDVEKYKPGVLWPFDLFREEEYFELLVKEIKNVGGFISYEEFRYGYI